MSLSGKLAFAAGIVLILLATAHIMQSRFGLRSPLRLTLGLTRSSSTSVRLRPSHLLFFHTVRQHKLASGLTLEHLPLSVGLIAGDFSQSCLFEDVNPPIGCLSSLAIPGLRPCRLRPGPDHHRHRQLSQPIPAHQRQCGAQPAVCCPSSESLPRALRVPLDADFIFDRSRCVADATTP